MGSDKRTNIFRIALIIIAVVMIVFGVMHGEVSIALRKAIKICLECIGIG